jgi:hypothetical protein
MPSLLYDDHATTYYLNYQGFSIVFLVSHNMYRIGYVYHSKMCWYCTSLEDGSGMRPQRKVLIPGA